MPHILSISLCVLLIACFSPASAAPLQTTNKSPDIATSAPKPPAPAPTSIYEEAFPSEDTWNNGAQWAGGTAFSTWVARNLAEEKDTAKFLKGLTGNEAFVEKRAPAIHRLFKSKIVGRSILGVGAASSLLKVYELYKVYRYPTMGTGVVPAARMSPATRQRLGLDGNKP